MAGFLGTVTLQPQSITTAETFLVLFVPERFWGCSPRMTAPLRVPKPANQVRLVLLVPYFTLLFLFPRLGLQALYTANSAYSLLDQQLRCFVVAYVFIYIATLFIQLPVRSGAPEISLSFLPCRSNRQYFFRLQPLAAVFGIKGAVIGFAITQFIIASATLYCAMKSVRSSRELAVATGDT